MDLFTLIAIIYFWTGIVGGFFYLLIRYGEVLIGNIGTLFLIGVTWPIGLLMLFIEFIYNNRYKPIIKLKKGKEKIRSHRPLW